MARMPLVPREPAASAVGSGAGTPSPGSTPAARSRNPVTAPIAAPARAPEVTMASTSTSTGTSPAAPPAAADTRARISAAAFELFAAQGYDSTTVDAVAERAGIARRTFFRYFRSKDDVIFPDHDSLLATVQQHLAMSSELSPVAAICGGVRLVFGSYVDDPGISVQRYRLTRSVSALRDRELASVRRYERMFSKYVRERLAGELGESAAMLRADVIAATVVAAHNAVLREWLRSGGTYDPMQDLENAFAWVMRTFEPAEPVDGAVAPAAPSQREGANDVVVAVFRASEPLDDVLERISRSL
jgi:AcrR family transcriptional regulator